MERYRVVYILGNLFMAFVIYKYMHIFYTIRRVNRHIEKVAYIGYFCLIILTHICLKIPIIVMAANLILLSLLTLLYEGTIKKAMISASVIYFSLMMVETIIAFLTSYLKLDLLLPFEYKSEFGIIVIQVASFALVLLAQGFKNVKYEVPIPNVYWGSLLIIPAGTVIMLFSIFMNPEVSRNMMLVCMVCAFAINLFTFYLYDQISSLLVGQMNQKVTEEQNRFYEHQVKMMKATLDSMKTIRHDLKNKLSPLYGLAKAEKYEELTEQLSELTSLYSINREYAKSGNGTIDSIINYKLQQAESESISISADVIVPAEISIPTFDVAVILGNLIDNAIEAVSKVSDRWIEIKLKYTKGRLIIEINNAYDGKIAGKEELISRKADKGNHGIGIKSVQTVLKKYDGAIQFAHDSNKFTVKALLYTTTVLRRDE